MQQTAAHAQNATRGVVERQGVIDDVIGGESIEVIDGVAHVEEAVMWSFVGGNEKQYKHEDYHSAP